jgi:pimeloyl-ACP methyl ester carboxylesterase
MSEPNEPKTSTLDVPGAVLYYDIRRSDSTTEPPLLLIGSPMPAIGFVTLASHFTDRTVVTYDPRASHRSKRTDDATVTTPDEHADDLHRLVSALGAELGTGPVDIFATSGGAVNGLAFVAKHPEQVRTLVAHEPPAASALPDRDALIAACTDIRETYERSGSGPAMAKFIAVAGYQGPLPDDYANQPAPDPAAFGLPAEDDGSRDDPLVGQNMPSCVAYQHDFDALGRASTRIVLVRGEDSGESMAARAAGAVAERLGAKPAVFPGEHTGFFGGEFGQVGKPDAFAAALREVLAGS